jgi:hypothetical protein
LLCTVLFFFLTQVKTTGRDSISYNLFPECLPV